MLILKRRVGERIIISDGICLTVVSIRGHRVRLGFTAPLETSIERREIHEARVAAKPPPQERLAV